MTFRIFVAMAIAMTCVAAVAKGASTTQSLYLYIDLGSLGGLGSQAMAVNSAGHATGWGQTTATDNQGNPIMHAFFWADANGNHRSDPGDLIDLGVLPGAVSTWGGDINEADVAVGYCSYESSETGFVWNWNGDRAMRDINTFVDPENLSNAGWKLTGAKNINDAGQVLCSATYTDPATGAERRNSVVLDLTTGAIRELAGDATGASDLNNAGQMTGGNPVGYLWQDGAQYEIGISNGAPVAIEDGGQVTGALHLNPGGHIFLWTPTVPNGTTGTYVDCGALRTPAVPMGEGLDVQVVNGTTTVVGDSRFGIYDKNGFLIFHAVRWQAATGLQDLNNLVSLPRGLTLRQANGLSKTGIIVGQTYGSYARAYELLPR